MAKKIFSQPIILSILIISLLIFSNNQGWLDKTKNYFFYLAQPVQRNLYTISLKSRNFASFLISLSNIYDENYELRRKNQEFLGQLSQLYEFNRENKFLREQLGLILAEGKQLILANVIGQDLSGAGKYLLINKGAKHGLTEKMAVITSGNILIGQIIEADYSCSKVQLITDINSRVNALIQNSEITGLVQGDFSDLLINLIPQGEELQNGELIITSGLAGIFPSGLIIGSIKEVISTDAAVFQKAKVEPAINFTTLEKVFIIKD